MKRKFSLMLLVVAMILVVAACGSSNAGKTSDSKGNEKVTLKMSTLSADGSLIHEGYEKFIEVVEAESGGEIKGELYANGQLASSDDQQFEMLKSKVAHVLSVPAFTVAAATGVDTLNIFDIPFMFSSLEEMYEVLDGSVGEKLIAEVEANSNVKVLGFMDLGTFSIGNTKQEVVSPTDLSGLKIRSTASKLHLDTVAELGATPSPIAYGEVFTALQQGTIDGLQTTTSLIYGDKLYEALDYLTVTRHVPLPHLVMINKEFYDSLSDKQKEAVEKAGEEHVKFARQLSIDDEKVAIETMIADGVEVKELNENELELFKEKAKPVVEKNINLIGKEFYEEVLESLGK